ncbi:MAG: hypothetical protein KGH57_01215 [Candidatus Micrarchaeota archaeon]|nr:hypothetical protein [Candidatus Micrarchaeota archaeon]
MKAQLSIEVLIGMALTLLVALTLLSYFSGSRSLISDTQRALSSISGAVSSYPARLAAG